MNKLFCAYHVGMFANEPLKDSPLAYSPLACFFEAQATSFHEAGHAVMAYALGLGCTRIELNATIKGDRVGYHGAAHSNRAAVQRCNRRLVEGRYCPELLAEGIFTAAGPAAERKHCLEAGWPIRALHFATGDHESISNIAKRLEWIGGRNRDAFRRLVWRQAQLSLEVETIWQAVCEVAERLNDLWTEMEGDDATKATMPGAEARAIMRRAGVRAGMLKLMNAGDEPATPPRAPWRSP